MTAAELIQQAERLAHDQESGASEILDAATSLLNEALMRAIPVQPLARALLRAQPAMAPIWTAVAEAVAAQDEPGRFDAFRQRVADAPRRLARQAVELLTTGTSEETPVRVVTLSYSRTVLGVLDSLRQARGVRVACCDSQPAQEGRRLATELARLGVPVTFYTDAAIAHALGSADALVLGADAVAPEWFLNKSGTRLLAAAAAQQGLPAYLFVTRDKFVSHAVAGRLSLRDGSPRDIWDSPPAGVTVRNPLFELTPLDLVTAVVSDLGVLGGALVPDVCNTMPGGPEGLPLGGL